MSLVGIGSQLSRLVGRINGVKVYHTDAYAIAVRNGFEGTEEEWLDSLKGDKGEKGDPGAVQSVGGIFADSTGNVPVDWMAQKTLQPLVILEETSISKGFSGVLKYEMLEGQDELAVTFDGKLFVCVPDFSYSADDGYLVWFGNRSLFVSGAEDTGEPFYFYGYKNSSSLIAMFEDTEAHTVSITGSTYDYVKLPEEYLPEGYLPEGIVRSVNGVTPDKDGNVKIAVNGDAKGLTTAQIEALDSMFKVCAFSKADVTAEYTAFKTAFGISDSDEGETHTHSYTSSVTTAATCTTAGVRTYTCSCGASYTAAIPATGHTYANGICTGCGAVDPDYEVEVTLTSISATYAGGDVTAGTSVDDLTDIVVTAHYSDGSTASVTGYTLSGTVAEGVNTITVSYGGKTTTFMVTGVAESGGGTESDVLFHVENTQVNALTDTGVDIYTADTDFTVCLYAVNKGSVQTGTAYWLTGLDSSGNQANGTDSPMLYYILTYNNNATVRNFIGNEYADITRGSGAIATDEYMKIVATHEKGSGLYTFSAAKNLGGKDVTETKTLTKEFTPYRANNADAIPATVAYGSTVFPILYNDLTIYNRVLSDEEIAAYLA